MLRSTVVGLAFLCTVGAAHADWQYTRWGMTVDQAIAASQGKLKACNPQACNGQKNESTLALAYGSYRVGEFSFTSFLMFDKADKKLAHVSLTLVNGEKALQLGSALRGRYGEPASRNSTTTPGFSITVWREKTDEVLFTLIGNDYANVTYRPRITSSNRGL
jgi:hypothetical protein